MTTAQKSRPRIVVGVDGSEPSTHALRWAARLAETFGASLDVVAAWHYPMAWGWNSVPLDWHPGEDTEKLLHETVDSVLGVNRNVEVRSAVHEGNAARVLLDSAEGALLVVVGSRGHGGFAGLLLGSVSTAVAEHATCPVLVVHGDEVLPAAVS